MDIKVVSITPDAEKIMGHIARVSNPSNQSNPNVSKLLKYCIDNGHWSVFETANIVFEIETSRAISAQILRHRSFTFQEFSQRYAAVDENGIEFYVARRQDNKNRQNSIDDLTQEVKDEWNNRQLKNWKDSFEHYQWALDNGIAKECARMVLPLQTKTKIYMNGTVRSWIHYLSLRCANGTQQEHMDIANEIKKQFKQCLPVIASALNW